MDIEHEEQLELGKKSAYEAFYNADKLFPVPRAGKRIELGINPECLPFSGYDVWNHYEVSWLNPKGKPVVALAEILYDCRSSHLIESKSLKLYFNTFNNTPFTSVAALEQTIARDLEKVLGTRIQVTVTPLNSLGAMESSNSLIGECLDDLDINCSVYSVDPSLLTVESEYAEEQLYSNLLKSNCLVTYQPDWGSVHIGYSGPKIQKEGLLQYLVSFRNHNEFHEQCIERIFVDIMARCKPQKLTVYGRYTRRGGIDINPYRTTEHGDWEAKNIRLIRQ